MLQRRGAREKGPCGRPPGKMEVYLLTMACGHGEPPYLLGMACPILAHHATPIALLEKLAVLLVFVYFKHSVFSSSPDAYCVV